jgi:predicted RNA-binding Zn-ribbon protein involved in translation (DUF1610 family)
MPWCHTCDRFLAPPTVTVDGTCPTCGRAVDRGALRVRSGRSLERRPSRPGPSDPADVDVDDLAPIPWHFKVLAVAVVGYLVFRFAQAFDWITSLL